MYAVIRTGGKQYRVSPGDTIEVEKLPGEVGDPVAIADVLMIGSDEKTTIGSPVIKGAEVTGTITGQYRGKKVTIHKFKRKTGYKKKIGHRQFHTEIKIDQIKG